MDYSVADFTYFTGNGYSIADILGRKMFQLSKNNIANKSYIIEKHP